MSRRFCKKAIFPMLFIFLFSNPLLAEDSNEDKVIKLYIASFNRAPDIAGLNYWLDEMNKNNWSIEMIAKSMFEQPETTNLYLNSTLEDFVNLVYQNVLNRDIDEASKKYWLNDLNQKNISKEHFIIAIINGANSDDSKLLNNKTSVGRYFSIEKNQNDLNLAKKIMKLVTIENNSVIVAKEKVEGKNSSKITISYGNSGEIYFKWWNGSEDESSIYLSNTQIIDTSAQLISTKKILGNYTIECKIVNQVENGIEYSCDNQKVIISSTKANYVLLKTENKTDKIGEINILQVQNNIK